MDFFAAVGKRVSVREYDSRPVENNYIEKIIDAARRAPTARAVEPWEFIAVRDKQLLKKLAEIATTGGFIKDSACCIVVYCEDTKYYLEDGCAATENILLAAAALGLGTCWVAGDKKPYADEVSMLLRVPAGLKLVSLISLGWPCKESAQVKKRGLTDVLHWDRF